MKTKPAASQVWRFGEGVAWCERTAATVDNHEVAYCVAGVFLRMPIDQWMAGSCVGVETTRGRVMVGERRREPGLPHAIGTVKAIVGADGVTIKMDDGRTVTTAAGVVAEKWQVTTDHPSIDPALIDAARCARNRFHPREQGPGIAALRPPESRPDVVYTWEAWALP